jgi:hypothetical protein
MNYENRYEIKKENNGTYSIFIKFTDDIFQDGFDSKKDAQQCLMDIFGSSRV